MSNYYDYRRAITNDIINYIKDNHINLDMDFDDLCEKLEDELWDERVITGNGIDFYDTEEKCYEYLKGNLPLFFEAMRELGGNMDFNDWMKNYPAEYMDCTIRCYLLNECIFRAIKEITLDEAVKQMGE